MKDRWTVAFVAGLVSLSAVLGANVHGAEAAEGGEPGVVEKVGETVKKVGKKIEEGVTKTAKKIEEKHVVEKVEQKLKKAADKTVEGFEKAGKKIDQKLSN